MEKFLVIGLGNPGQSYADSRHNIGFKVTSHIREKLAFSRWIEHKGTSRISRGRVGPESKEVILCQPSTYMNNSGGPVKTIVKELGLGIHQLIVVCDDFSLELGRIRIRRQGSAGGHNGLKSLIAELNTMDFPRIKIGIGPVPNGADPADFVLSDFTPSEQKIADKIIDISAKAIETILYKGLEEAMNVYNASNSITL